MGQVWGQVGGQVWGQVREPSLSESGIACRGLGAAVAILISLGFSGWLCFAKTAVVWHNGANPCVA
jgi:hypothetical protein